jgi:hypothetical protein
MPAETVESLSILVTVDEPAADATPPGTRGLLGRRDSEVGVREVPVAILRDNLRRTVDGLRALFEEIAAEGGPLPLKEAQISFEVTASGGVNVLGTSAQASGTGAITLTFGR